MLSSWEGIQVLYLLAPKGETIMSNPTYTSMVKYLLGQHAGGAIDKDQLYRGLRKARKNLEKKS